MAGPNSYSKENRLDLGRLILKVCDYITLSTVLTPEETTVR
jgi:hypothetical protein